MNRKITAEQIMEYEAQAMVEVLGRELELNDSFLREHCSPEFAAILAAVPEEDRGYVLEGIDYTARFPGFIPGPNNDILLPYGEIEYQFEGSPEDAFEDPDDWYIDSDLAYLYTGYGLAINFDREQLEQAIKEAA